MDEVWRAFKTLAPYAGLLTFLLGGVSFLIRQWMAGQKKIKEMEAKEVLSSFDSLKTELADHKSALNGLNNNMLLVYEKLGTSNARLERVSTSSDLLVKAMATSQKDSIHRLKHLEETLERAEMKVIGKNLFMITKKKD